MSRAALPLSLPPPDSHPMHPANSQPPTILTTPSWSYPESSEKGLQYTVVEYASIFHDQRRGYQYFFNKLILLNKAVARNKITKFQGYISC